MKFRINLLALVVVLLSGIAFGSDNSLAKEAVAGTETDSAEAVRKLREMGPEGLKGLIGTHAEDIKEYRETGRESENWKKIAAALDAVAMQKDAYASQLYWYTDLEQAKRAAAKADKPILSLRLLGNLNEEFSCANSRLFRSILYPNREISKFLRENYVLHWRSVRPAPRVTIDFGDGRKIERTLTGNSIHYILDGKGTVIDALPGLYSPPAFLSYVTEGKQVNDSILNLPAREKSVALLRYRKRSFDRIKAKRDNAMRAAKVELVEPKAGADATSPDIFNPDPRAITVSNTAMTKSIVTDEISILRVYDDFARFEPAIDLTSWQKLADIYSPGAKIDSESIAFIRRQNAKTGLTTAEFDAMLSKLQNFLALDTTRNDFLYHTELYEGLNREPAADLESFNARVYSDIFKTPNSDKWLGLYSSDVYTALDGNGIIK